MQQEVGSGCSGGLAENMPARPLPLSMLTRRWVLSDRLPAAAERGQRSPVKLTRSDWAPQGAAGGPFFINKHALLNKCAQPGGLFKVACRFFLPVRFYSRPSVLCGYSDYSLSHCFKSALDGRRAGLCSD